MKKPSLLKRRGFTIIPFFGDLVAMVRLLMDPKSATWAKVLVVAAIAYVVFPADAVPDVAPILGWLDDVGAVLILRLILSNRLDPYRYPLFGSASAARDTLPPRAASDLISR